jgi:transcription initiation factor TFIIIB Brf1 subunit/transcription initiation factor TFIIB
VNEEKADRIIELLEEILKWTRLEGLQKAKVALTELLKTESERLAYEYSDGRTSREVAVVVGVSHATIANYWKKWARYGIVTERSSRGGGTRYKRLFSLSDFGIDVPRITEQAAIAERESEAEGH